MTMRIRELLCIPDTVQIEIVADNARSPIHSVTARNRRLRLERESGGSSSSLNRWSPTSTNPTRTRNTAPQRRVSPKSEPKRIDRDFHNKAPVRTPSLQRLGRSNTPPRPKLTFPSDNILSLRQVMNNNVVKPTSSSSFSPLQQQQQRMRKGSVELLEQALREFGEE